MNLVTVLALLQAVPGIFAEAQNLMAGLGAKDQATLDAAIKAAQEASINIGNKLESDVGGSGNMQVED